VVSYGLVDASYEKRLRETADEVNGPLFMLSLTKFRPGSGQVLGRNSSQDPDSRYIPIPLLRAVGASLCVVADVVAGSEDFDRVGVIRYPTRRAFVELNGRSDAMEWNATKERRAERLMMLGMSPTGGLPAELSQRVLLEIWQEPAPEPIAAGTATEFEIEGTYIGDGRRWSGARYTTLDPGAALPLEPARFGYLAVLVAPIIERWI
jgi:hypothetical protein